MGASSEPGRGGLGCGAPEVGGWSGGPTAADRARVAFGTVTVTRPAERCAVRGGRALLAVLLCAAACGDGADSGDATAPVSDRSSPFTAGPPPEGYRPIIAGRGTAVQSWGDDEGGTHEPFTVLAPPGQGADSPAAVVVSVTGFEGYQGSLSQASVGYLHHSQQAFTLAGRPAIFTPAGRTGEGQTWADLVAVKGPDLAVRVTAREATREELIRVLERVRPAESHAVAPKVLEPPAGLRVIGSVDADLLLALTPTVQPQSDIVPGPSSAHGVGWYRGESRLAVMTLPGRAADLAALGGLRRFGFGRSFNVQPFTLQGQPAVFIVDDYGGEEVSEGRVLVAATSWGDLSVTFAAGPDVPSRDDVERVAASLAKAGPEAWDRFVTEMAGGPGLEADDGAVELARGEAGGVGWLLQAGPGDDRLSTTAPEVEERQVTVDRCLKLSNRRRACTSGSAGGSDGDVGWSEEPVRSSDGTELPDFPAFVIVRTTAPGVMVRVRTSAGEATGVLHPLPAPAGASAAVVFVSRPGLPGCHDRPPPAGLDVMRVEVLQGDGRVVACIGVT